MSITASSAQIAAQPVQSTTTSTAVTSSGLLVNGSSIGPATPQQATSDDVSFVGILTGTLTADAVCEIQVSPNGTGTALDNQWLTVSTINAGRTQVTAPYAGNVTWSGSVLGLKPIDGIKLARMCDDFAKAGVDVALWWMIDSDPARPVGESIQDAGNEELRATILDANTALGW